MLIMFFFNNSRGTSIEVEIANVVNFFEFVKCELKKFNQEKFDLVVKIGHKSKYMEQ